MSVIATITTSIDGYVTGPDDRTGQGLGVGGERLHHWVMGGVWTYEGGHDTGAATGADREHLDGLSARVGAAICGRGMFEAAGRWGGTNPFDGPLFVVTHRMDDAPDPSTGFTFVEGIEEALERAGEVAGDRDVSIAGGADVIRQALAAGLVDELALSTAPVILGTGKRLFDGFTGDIDLRIVDVVSSDLATHTRYEIVR
jgi:dihydrofolate reductase